MASLNGVGAALPKDLGVLEVERPARAGGASFADALGKAIAQTDRLQLEADGQAAEVAKGGGNLHETAIALEKADVALRIATKVRNKVVEAYQDVMRMQI